MANEAKTDLWVYELLKEANIDFFPQGSDIKEVKEALKTASKWKTGKQGYPEYTAKVKDFLIVIENKASVSDHEIRDDNLVLREDADSLVNYAVNGALFYGLHLSKNTSFKKIIAIGIS